MRSLLLALATAVLAGGCTASERKPASESPAAGEVEIVGGDYSFKAPAELPAGRVAVRFRNTGKVRHELNISLLKQGVPAERVVEAVKADKTVRDLIDGSVGVLFAEPGERSAGTLATNMVPGREYVVICIFKDSASTKSHLEQGMYSVIRTATAPAPTQVVQHEVDTIIGTDYAFQYRPTLAPGLHRFAFRNAGKMRHQISISQLTEGTTIEKLFALEKAGVNVDSLFARDYGLLHARGGQAPLGELVVDLQPGKEYIIVCYFQDDPKSPPHHHLGMYGVIRVSGAKSSANSGPAVSRTIGSG